MEASGVVTSERLFRLLIVIMIGYVLAEDIQS